MNIELPEFCCPLCKGALASDENQYVCSRCQRSYPVVLGIPDFRVFPDPYIDYESDYQKGAYLLENSRALNFQDTVRLYWKITPLKEKFKDIFEGHGIWKLIPQGKGTRRIIEGNLSIKMPIVGKVVEQFLAGELKKNYDVEPDIQRKFYRAKREQEARAKAANCRRKRCQ